MIDYSNNFSLDSLFYIDDNGIVCQEEWKEIQGYNGKYQVSNLGRLKTFNYRRNAFILKQEQIKSGYKRASLSILNIKKRHLVHVLVSQEFLGHKHNHSFKVIDHIDDNKINNFFRNLRIVNHRDNIIKNKIGITGQNNIRIMKGKFQVRFIINKKQKYFGCYKTIEEAIIVRDNVVKEIKNDFEKHLI